VETAAFVNSDSIEADNTSSAMGFGVIAGIAIGFVFLLAAFIIAYIRRCRSLRKAVDPTTSSVPVFKNKMMNNDI